MTKFKRYFLSVFLTALAFLTLSGWVMYIERTEMNVVPASLPNFYLSTDDFLWNGGYVTAKGTWTMEAPEMMANPVRTSEITCVYKDKVCREATAEISIFSGAMLHLHTDIHSILKWDSEQIVYFNDSAICNVYFYYINRVTKQVTGVRKIKKDAPNDVCGKFTDKDIKLNLSDGFSVYWNLKMGAMSQLVRVTPLLLILVGYIYSIWFVWRKLSR